MYSKPEKNVNLNFNSKLNTELVKFYMDQENAARIPVLSLLLWKRSLLCPKLLWRATVEIAETKVQ